MFFFGSPEDTAQLYWRNSTEITGPVLAEAPLDEMSEAELRVAITYARIAYKMAVRDGATQEAIEVLLEEYDNVFQALAEISPTFVASVRGDAILPLGGHSAENVAKYKRLAGVGN